MEMNESSSAKRTEEPFDLQRLLDSLTLSEKDEGSKASDPVSAPSRVLRGSAIRPSVSAMDVAEYILRKLGRMSTMKLQKLVYYSQAWSLVWDESPLFSEDIQAWANGPVIPKLFNYHRGNFEIDKVLTGNPDLLSDSQKETVDAVLDFYGGKSAQWLIDLSHSEEPWKHARRGLPETTRGMRTIPLESMGTYYSALSDEG